MFRHTSSASILAACLLFSASAYSQTLQDTVTQALDNNPDLMIDTSRRLSLDEALKSAQGGYLPKVDLALGHGPEWSNNNTTRASDGGGLELRRKEASLTLRQMLFDGFGVKSEVARNRARVESAKGKLAATSDRVALDAIEAYLEVVRHRQLVALTQANLLAHQRTQDQIRLRSDSGHGRRSDFEQVSARVALAKANLEAVKANLADAETNFMSRVGKRPGALSEMEQLVGSIPGTLDEALEIALREHPANLSALADINAARAQQKLSKAAMWPRVDLEIGTSNNNNVDGVAGPNDDSYAMFRLRYALFNGGSDRAKIRENAHVLDEANAVRDRTLREIEQSTRLSWNAMTAAKARLSALKDHADYSALTRDAYATQFGVGQRTLLDMLDAENEAYTAATNYLGGKMLSAFAHYRVLADMGRLTKVFRQQQ